MPLPIRGMLFDLDNTLADREAAFTSWSHWFAREHLGLRNAGAIEAVVAVMVVLDDDGHLPREKFFQSVKTLCPSLDAEVPELIETFRSELSAHLSPLDGAAVRLLAEIETAGIPWGIVTNGSSQNQRRKLPHLGLEAHAGCILISEEVGLRKPDAAIFHLAAARLGTPVHEVLFIGDHPEADVVGAAGAGMQTAWLHRNRSWPADLAAIAPDYQIATLRELHSLISRPSLT